MCWFRNANYSKYGRKFRATLAQIYNYKLLFFAKNQKNSITCVDLARKCASKLNSRDQKRVSFSKMRNAVAQPSHAMSVAKNQIANYDIFRCACLRKNSKRSAFNSFVHQCLRWKVVSKQQFYWPTFWQSLSSVKLIYSSCAILA